MLFRSEHMMFKGSRVIGTKDFEAEWALIEKQDELRAGMIAEISVVQEEIADALVAPQEALVAMEDGYVVFVVEGAGDGLKVENSFGSVTVRQAAGDIEAETDYASLDLEQVQGRIRAENKWLEARQRGVS